MLLLHKTNWIKFKKSIYPLGAQLEAKSTVGLMCRECSTTKYSNNLFTNLDDKIKIGRFNPPFP